MKRVIHVSEAARRDMAHVFGFIALQSPQGAELVAKRIEQCMGLLQVFPELGPRVIKHPGRGG